RLKPQVIAIPDAPPGDRGDTPRLFPVRRLAAIGRLAEAGHETGPGRGGSRGELLIDRAGPGPWRKMIRLRSPPSGEPSRAKPESDLTARDAGWVSVQLLDVADAASISCGGPRGRSGSPGGHPTRRPLGPCRRPLHAGRRPVSNASLGEPSETLVWRP